MIQIMFAIDCGHCAPRTARRNKKLCLGVLGEEKPN